MVRRCSTRCIYLLETNQHGLPVIDDSGGLVGIVSECDFLHRKELGVSVLHCSGLSAAGKERISARTRANGSTAGRRGDDQEDRLRR
jgi:hypothetical protein